MTTCNKFKQGTKLAEVGIANLVDVIATFIVHKNRAITIICKTLSVKQSDKVSEFITDTLPGCSYSIMPMDGTLMKISVWF